MADAQSIRGTLISFKITICVCAKFFRFADHRFVIQRNVTIFSFFPSGVSEFTCYISKFKLSCFSGEDDVDETGGQMSNVGQQVDGSSDAEESQRLVS